MKENKLVVIAAAMRNQRRPPRQGTVVDRRSHDPGGPVSNFSICGLPFYLSGEIFRLEDPGHRTIGEIEEKASNVA